MEKIYRVQMNSSGMPNFATAVEIDTEISEYSDKLWKNAYERGKADRPQGEWQEKEIFGEYNDDVHHYVSEWQSARCSVCGKYHTTPDAYYFDEYNFCPSCGARMRPKLQGTHYDSIIIDECAMRGADDE